MPLSDLPAAPLAPSADVLAQVGDALVWPLLILLPDGTLLHANHAARRLMAHPHPLALRPDGRLKLGHEPLQAAFDEAVQATSTGGAPRLLHWPATETSTAFTATLSPLAGRALAMRDAQPHEGRLDNPCPVLLALASADSRQQAADAFASLHGLTAAETRVLRHLACGERSVDIARALQVTPSTVRSQLLHLRRRTGHDSVASLQNALVRMPPLMPLSEPAKVNTSPNTGDRFTP